MLRIIPFVAVGLVVAAVVVVVVVVVVLDVVAVDVGGDVDQVDDIQTKVFFTNRSVTSLNVHRLFLLFFTSCQDPRV